MKPIGLTAKTFRLVLPCSEQARQRRTRKQLTAEEVRLPERDTTMSEQKQGYMAELDQWTHEFVIERILGAEREIQDAGERLTAAESERIFNDAVSEAKRAIREKVLESYRNGQAAGPAKRP